MILCEQCRTEIHRKRSQIFRANRIVKHFFCSKKCSHEFRKGKRNEGWTEKHSLDSSRRFKKMWEERREELMNKRPRRENHPNWKGGRVMMNGYFYIRVPEHPRANSSGYVREHIIIAEKIIGRPLKNGETIHHVNEIKTDNRPDNLYLFNNQSEHASYHHNWGRSIPKITESNLATVV